MNDWKSQLAWIVAVEFVGIGVFFAWVVGAIVANGGRLTLDMTQFGEMWIEYWVVLVCTATLPWALWYLTSVEGIHK